MHKLEHLQRLLSEGRITRRDFISNATALGLATAIPSVILTEQAKADAPKKGGTLRIGVGAGSTSDSLDPGLQDNAFLATFTNAMRDRLTEYTNKKEIIGSLAEQWETSPDAKQWIFTLRKDIEFHNGKTLDANDVVVSLNHHVAEGTTSGAKPLIDPITDIKADGDKVIVTLEAGNADFPFFVYDPFLQIMPANADGTPDWQSGIGTGPYILDNWEPGVRGTLKKNPNYWNPDRGHFDNIEMLPITDINARTNALRSDVVDVIDRCDLKTVHLLARDPNINIVDITGTRQYTYPMHMDVAPFDNNDVRMALKLGIDREALVETVLKGYGAAGNDHPIAPANRFYNKDLPQRAYDPEKAKWHLKQAGLESLEVDLSVADAAYVGAADAAVLYQAQAAPAGIKINVVREPSDGYWSNVWLKKPFCAAYWSGRLVEDAMFSTEYLTGQPWNDSHFSHQRFDELVVAARAELDENKRREMYYETQQILRDEGGVIIPMFSNYVSATNKKVQQMDGGWAADYDLDGYMGPQRWWFA